MSKRVCTLAAVVVVLVAVLAIPRAAARPGCQPGQHSTWHVFCSPHKWIWDSW